MTEIPVCEDSIGLIYIGLDRLHTLEILDFTLTKTSVSEAKSFPTPHHQSILSAVIATSSFVSACDYQLRQLIMVIDNTNE